MNLKTRFYKLGKKLTVDKFKIVNLSIWCQTNSQDKLNTNKYFFYPFKL